jgi:hypothetical protein
MHSLVRSGGPTQNLFERCMTRCCKHASAFLSPRSAPARFGRPGMAPRREWREFERGVVLIEHEIDVAKETAVDGVPSGEHFSLAVFDIFLANGATPHR